MSEVRGGSGARGNPAPRRALSRFSPLEAEEGGAAAPVPPAGADEASPAAAPGGTQGRDLLIPARPPGRAKDSPQVPSVADLMPAAAPSGRRTDSERNPAGHGRPLPANDATKAAGKKSGKEAGKEAGKSEKVVSLQVPLTKALRKRLKARAAEFGLSPEDTVAQLVQVWLEG